MRLVVVLAALLFTLPGAISHAEAAGVPQTRYWDGEHLAIIRGTPKDQPAPVRESLRQLSAEADLALGRGPYSVVDKKLTPASGDKHDYMSFSRYWWPNPETADGLPYVRRDGEVNRKLLSQGDRVRIGQFFDDVETLSLAAYLIDKPKYAPHAVRLLRTWFITPRTRMNPNLNFGQAVPGRAVGRAVGIIDTRHFIRVLDGVALLEELDALEEQDRLDLRDWFRRYAAWLVDSQHGVQESAAGNNHGAWYAAQLARIALFIDDRELTREIVSEVHERRILASIEPDGRQPHELERTRSLHYSLFCLSAFSVVARMGEHVGLDLWDTSTPPGARLRRGFGFVAPYLAQPDEWKYPEMGDFAVSDGVRQLMLLASSRYEDDGLLSGIAQEPRREDDRHYAALLFPEVQRGWPPSSEAESKYQVTRVEGPTPDPPVYTLPDLSLVSSSAIKQRAPQPSGGVARIVSVDEVPLLAEAFRDERGKDLRRRQGANAARAILVESGVMDLRQVADQLRDPRVLGREGKDFTLRLPMLVGAGAALVVESSQTRSVRLSTDRGAFIANAGRLFLFDVEVTSWDESAGKPSVFQDKSRFRPFLSAYIRSETYAVGCTIQHLGFAAPTAYGFSLSSHPERERGKASPDWPTGALVGNTFRGLYYGFYSYEARDVAIVGNRYVDSIVYGIDPHDRSTRLIIARNTCTGTVEKHGIIGSRGVSHSYIFDNDTFKNHGSGVMLDRQCSHNLVHGNRVHQNGQGIAVYESPSNIVLNNLVAFNEKSGVRVRNSTDILVQANTITGCNDYALEVSARKLDDHAKRAARGDDYSQEASVFFYANRVKANRGLVKGLSLSLLRIGDVSSDVDPDHVAAQLGFAAGEYHHGNDCKFGQELRPDTARLKAVCESPELVLEVSPTGKPSSRND